MRLLDPLNVEGDDRFPLKTGVRGVSSSQLERKLYFRPRSNCFTRTVSLPYTLVELIRASYWRRTLAALTMLRGNTEKGYGCKTSKTALLNSPAF